MGLGHGSYVSMLQGQKPASFQLTLYLLLAVRREECFKLTSASRAETTTAYLFYFKQVPNP